MSSQSSAQRNLARRIIGTTMPISRKRTKWQRNWPCICGSGLKYKACCLINITHLDAVDGNANVVQLSEDVQKLVDAYKEAEKASLVAKDGGIKTNE